MRYIAIAYSRDNPLSGSPLALSTNMALNPFTGPPGIISKCHYLHQQYPGHYNAKYPTTKIAINGNKDVLGFESS